MIALLHQQGVARVGTKGGKGGLPTAIHVDTRLGNIFGAIGSFGVDIGEKTHHGE